MFHSADQAKLAHVLGETFDPYTLAGQFNAVAKALASSTPRSDHSHALLNSYRGVLNSVAERQYSDARNKVSEAVRLEGVLVITPAQGKIGRGGTPAATVCIKTAQGDVTVHLTNVKPFDFAKRAQVVFAALKDQKVSAKGYLWANETGLHLMLDDAKDLARFSPAAKKIASLRKPK